MADHAGRCVDALATAALTRLAGLATDPAGTGPPESGTTRSCRQATDHAASHDASESSSDEGGQDDDDGDTGPGHGVPGDQVDELVDGMFDHAGSVAPESPRCQSGDEYYRIVAFQSGVPIGSFTLLR